MSSDDYGRRTAFCILAQRYDLNYAVLGMIMLSNILLTFRLAALESQVANLSWVLKEQDISSTSQSQSCFSEDLDCS